MLTEETIAVKEQKPGTCLSDILIYMIMVVFMTRDTSQTYTMEIYMTDMETSQVGIQMKMVYMQSGGLVEKKILIWFQKFS